MRIKEKIKNELVKKSKLTIDELKKRLRIARRDKRWFFSILKQMHEEGSIYLEGDYILASKPKEIEGTFIATKYGYGFIKSDEFEKDFFVQKEHTMGALDNDRVKFIVLRNDSKTRARITEVIRDKDKFIVGEIDIKKRKALLIPDTPFDFDIFITNPFYLPVKKNGVYKVKLNSYDEKRMRYLGEIVEFLGMRGEKHVDLYSLVAEAGVPRKFSNEVLKEAEEVSKERLTKRGRTDFRDLFTVTIDGLDAKDFDDAISVSKSENGYILYVHIADVSHYVKEDSKLDKEAYERQMSIYLPGLVIPMLPKALSNGICSLNPNENRYALSVTMEVTKDKKPKLLSIDKSIIKSDYRLNYTDLNDYYNNGNTFDYEDDLISFLDEAREVYEILKSQSIDRGTIQFESRESKIEVDDKGRVINITPRKSDISEKLIEECMIATNRVIATKYFSKEYPFMYRVHPKPEEEKLENLKYYLRPYGIRLQDEPTSMDIQKVLSDAREKDEFEVINDLILRSMAKARYSEENDGHYALALQNYSHFTSPIRRYPDLFIHRIISLDLKNKLTKTRFNELTTRAKKAAERASNIEKIIVDLEREADQLKKCEFMKDKVGEEFVGKITSLTEFGVFIELDNTVSGLVNDSHFLEIYNYNEKENTALLKGKKKALKIGKKIKVRLSRVDMVLLKIDFEYIGEDN